MAEAQAQRNSNVEDGFPFNTAGRVFTAASSDEVPDVGQSTVHQDATEVENRLSTLPELPSVLKQFPAERQDRPEPQPRRSVQFARLPENDQLDGALPAIRPATDRKGSRADAFLSKLKVRTGTARGAHARSPSEQTVGASSPSDPADWPQSSGAFSWGSSDVQSSTNSPRLHESEDEADEEVSEDETNGQRPAGLRKRKSKRPQNGAQTAPSTPMIGSAFGRVRPGFFSSLSQQAGEAQSRPGLIRRATTTELGDESRQGVSEDEGRSRMALKAPSPWTRGKKYLPRRSSSNQLGAGFEARTPGAFRRAISGIASSNTPTGTVPPSPWRERMRRNPTKSIGDNARWQRIKAGLKAMGRLKKAENPLDTIKSAELLNELTAGAPAALMLASIFQRDEGGSKKIPILLEQLKFKLTNSQAIMAGREDRHLSFRLDLEYGSGVTRMKWSVERTPWDFWSLHYKYYQTRINPRTRRLRPDIDGRQAKMPKFPKRILPYARGLRGVDIDEDAAAEPENNAAGQTSAGEPEPIRPAGRSRPSMNGMPSMSGILRRQSSLTGDEAGDGLRGNSVAGAQTRQARREEWPERTRRQLENYLHDLIRYLTFRPGTNRLCKFLELSALGVRLAAEGSYHGKEGRMTIVSGKGIDFRRAWKPGLFKDRHTPKWFMVRHSYIVCVASPQSLEVYDVFLVDSDFKVQAKEKLRSTTEPEKMANGQPKRGARGPHHLTLYNSERSIKLAAKNARQLTQFVQSIRTMSHNTQWSGTNRFNSFAPVRKNVSAQWLVDGRDYMWNVSRAISMAKDVIYIHDWWLSPELYLRRPAAISSKWRLDRLLQERARAGVKIFVIMYRNVESAIPIDSAHSKLALLDLHENIFVQRSPNQLRQGTFFWAHHEKICVIDHAIAFVGGVDLCFGRWDTPQHPVADDKPTGFEDNDLPRDADNCQLFPGKDYSNPRVQDFYGLDKPYEEMYNRSRVPRMPWHDIHMQVVGQPARDLTRHFVQRWNFILRSRVPSRPTPFLLPPKDFEPGELENLGLAGTCEVQILRSCTEWSIGTPGKTEHSIMTAYCTIIKQSEHFIYIENQFFISSCEVEGHKIANNIGDAIVERIIRAHENDEDWKAVIIIPLMPGFQNTVDAQDGTSVRLIMQCQFRSISRGDGSIFQRLRKAGIDPEDYIQFFSLRSWGRVGANRSLVTEQLYIHAKCMIADDRVAIIASANINERSQRGDRDSECGAVVRDADSMWSKMAGKDYLVGRFPHTLRMRLMREHLGLDVDALEDHDHGLGDDQESATESTPKKWLNKLTKKSKNVQSEAEPPTTSIPTWRDGPERGIRVTGNTGIDLSSDEESLTHRPQSRADSMHTRRSKRDTLSKRDRSLGPEAAPLPPPAVTRMNTYELGLPQLSTLPTLPTCDDTDIGGPGLHKSFSTRASAQAHPLLSNLKLPEISADCMKDPLNNEFYDNIWKTVAENNTALFRAVFRCMPDNEVKEWSRYHEYMDYAEKFSQAQGAGKSVERTAQEAEGSTGPPGSGSLLEKIAIADGHGKKSSKSEHGAEQAIARAKHNNSIDEKKALHNMTDSAADNVQGPKGHNPSKESIQGTDRASTPSDHRLQTGHSDNTTEPELNEKAVFPAYEDTPPSKPTLVDGANEKSSHDHSASTGGARIQLQLPQETNVGTSGSRRTRRSTTKSRRRTIGGPNDEPLPKEEAEELLKMVQGHLIYFPYDWLVKEDEAGNWLFSIDQLAPLEIYD